MKRVFTIEEDDLMSERNCLVWPHQSPLLKVNWRQEVLLPGEKVGGEVKNR